MRSPLDVQAILNSGKTEADDLVNFTLNKSWDHPNFNLTPLQLLPSETLIEGVIHRLNLTDISLIPSGQGEIWESKPSSSIANRLPDVSDLLNTFNSQQEELSKVEVPSSSRQSISMLGIQTLWNEKFSSAKNLRLHINANTSGFYMQLQASDSAGKIVASAHFLPSMTDENLEPSDLARRLEAHKKTRPVELTPEEVRLFDNLSRSSTGEVPDRMFHPDKFEPLNYLVAKAIFLLSNDDPEGCFVAELPDSLLGIAQSAVSGNKFDIEEFKGLLNQSTPYEKVVKNDAVVWRSSDPEWVEGTRADRRDLARFLQGARNGSAVDTYTKALLWHSSPKYPASLADKWLTLWNNRMSHEWQSNERSFVSLPSDLFYLIGAIQPSDWQALESGVTSSPERLGVGQEFRRLLGRDLTLSRVNPAIPEIQRHGADLMGAMDVNNVKIYIKPTSQPVMRFWIAGEKQRLNWVPLDLRRIGARGLVRASYNMQTNQPFLQTDRKDFEDSLSGLTCQFATLNSGFFVVELPLGGTYDAQLSSVPTEVTPFEKYSDLPESTRSSLWEFASNQQLTVVRNTTRAALGLPIESDPPQN